MQILQRDAELQEVVQLVGPDALQDADRATLELGRMLREDFLQQNAFSETDASCSPEKQLGLLESHIRFHDLTMKALENGTLLDDILATPLREDLAQLRNIPEAEFGKALSDVYEHMESYFTGNGGGDAKTK